jgi:23S rRNA (uracil1939-C5)-methyltransferase
MVENAIREYTALKGVTPNPVLPSPVQLHYRNSARFIVAGKFTAPVIGIKNRKTRDVMELDDCPLYHPLINRIVQAVKEGIRKGKVPVYSPRSDSGLLCNLSVRVSEAETRAMVSFVTAERSFNEIHHLGKYLQTAVPEVEVIVQNVNNPSGKLMIGNKEFFVTRKRFLTDIIGNTRFIVTPRSFLPVNRGGALLIHEKVREWAVLSGQESVLDLFFGNGSLSLFLSRWAKEVVGIETAESSVVEAEKNARLNGIRNCRFEAGDVTELLTELRNEGVSPGLISINMLAKGYEREVLQQAAALAPARIILLSGSLQQLAHDLDILSRIGYRTLEVQPVDMFPQTPRVDTLTLMAKE